MILAWTAAYVIALAGGIALGLILLRLAIVGFAPERTRLIFDALFALLCLALLLLLF